MNYQLSITNYFGRRSAIPKVLWLVHYIKFNRIYLQQAEDEWVAERFIGITQTMY